MRFRLETTSDGSLTVFDREAGECFKSRHAARTEAEHVFYGPAVRENPWFGRATPFRVLELGLGLGTNFAHFRASGFRGEFTTIERDVAGAEFLLAHEPDPALRGLLAAGAWEADGFRATLHRGDFAAVMAELPAASFHAVLFDPFSPKANPEAWEVNIFQLAARLLAPGGRLVTYSVSRVAKDSAARAGLRVEKRALPESLQKRAALLAVKPEAV